jgi:hypothetical protein
MFAIIWWFTLLLPVYVWIMWMTKPDKVREVIIVSNTVLNSFETEMPAIPEGVTIQLKNPLVDGKSVFS